MGVEAHDDEGRVVAVVRGQQQQQQQRNRDVHCLALVGC
jgi:hypothetical protein